MVRRFARLIGLTLTIAIPAGCQPPPSQVNQTVKINYAAPLPEGRMALRLLSPAEYPDFARGLMSADLDALKRAADNSLVYFHRRGSERAYPYLNITRDRALATLTAFRRLLDEGPFRGSPQELNRRIADEFQVYASVGAPNPDGTGFTGEVLFTGYFTPTYDADVRRGGPYQWPLYRRPKDLITDESGERAGRREGSGIVPYYTREQIENGHVLDGDELVWLTSRWDAYVVTVQGSGRLRLPDGRILEVGYAGTNGYPYTSPGLRMVADGLIPSDRLSFEAMREFFRNHPDAMGRYLPMNRRTTFFAETRGGPFGSINVPVTPFASIATDKSVYPPGMPAFIDLPTSYAGRNLAGRFVFDQDRGGAIRSAGRCDIYMGIGQSAEQMSGRQLSSGRLYYLALKSERTPPAAASPR